MKAIQFTVDISDSPKVKRILANRRNLFVNQIKQSYECYGDNEALKVSVDTKYTDAVRSYFLDHNCYIVSETSIFRVQDYAFVQRKVGYRIVIYADYLCDALERYEETYDLDFDPPFQRGYVWTKEQQIAYIEYLLSGAESGREIYFNCPDFQGNHIELQKMVVVDGKQRLTALTAFINNEFEVFGLAQYHMLRHEDKSRLELYFNVNGLKDQQDVIKWYVSMNTGGSVHTEEDLQTAKALLDENR